MIKLVKKKVNVLTLICVTIFSFIYMQVHHLQFQMQWDDYWVVINQYTNKGFTTKNVKEIFFTFYHGQYAPLNEFYYILIKALFGYNPVYFHMGSVIIHAFNAVCVYWFIRILSSRVFNKSVDDANYVSIITAFIFAIHPFNVEAVAWISASKILLYSTFYLLGLIFYMRYLMGKKIQHIILVFLFFIFSFGAKEQAVTFPVSLLLFDYLFHRNYREKSFWMEKLLFFGIALYFGVITLHSQGQSNGGTSDDYSTHERFLLATLTLIEYLTKSLIPVKLSYLYPFPFIPGDVIPTWLYFYAGMFILIFVISVKLIFKSNLLLFSFGFFLINIAIVLNLLNMTRHSLIADRYAYLSTIGIAFLLVNLILYYFKNIKTNLIKTLPALYLMYFSIYTNIRIKDWTNSRTLKQDMSDRIKNREDYNSLTEFYED